MTHAVRDALAQRVAALIDRLKDGARDDAARDALLADVLLLQREQVAPYARMLARLAASEPDPLRWPALPTDVFRFARVAAHAAHEDVRVFRTSGTTSGARGAHPLRDLSLYDRSAHAAARHALFPDVARMPLVILAPRAAELPDSSLSYMLDRFTTWFGLGDSVWVIEQGELQAERLERMLSDAQRDERPVALLGTSFAFVHAEDALGARRFRLPRGSRIMQTGGFKGRTRELAPEDMRALLQTRYGVDERCIVSEYGMTELCSQLYETTLRDAWLGRGTAARRLWVPGWVRASVVDPEALVAIEGEREGLLRIDDPCNLDGACAVQTADRALCVDGGVVVLGRAADAVPRGCSLAIDAVLGG
jgi:hypothetical protein